MAKANRFMFELDFDDARNLGDKPPEPTFSADELNAARGVARAEGIEAGRAEAMRSIERRAGESVARIAQRLGEAAAMREASLHEIERNALELCVVLMRRLFPEFQRRHGSGEIEQLVRDSLRVMIDEPRVVVRLSDDNPDLLREQIAAAATSAGFAGKVVLVGDDQIAPGDCAIEWADGGTERNGDRLWAEIDAAIRRLTAPEQPSAEQPTADQAAEQTADQSANVPGDAAHQNSDGE